MTTNIISEFLHTLSLPEVKYTGLIFALFVFPRFLIRFGIPYALTAFAMGVCASFLEWELGGSDAVKLLSSLGIISLFLFAGLEVEFGELRQSRRFLVQHVIVSVVLLIISSVGLTYWLKLDVRPAVLLGLALLTPSTGFILDTINTSSVPEAGKFWIRSKAIAAEIVALFLMFVLVRSMSAQEFTFAMVGMGLLILALPLAFKFFAKVVEPAAPKSEFGFLLMIALLSGMITKKLGAYYLIGAFVVGIVARRFEGSMPRLTSKPMLRSIRSFTGFFIPFYFFHAGSSVSKEELSLKSLGIGLAMIAVFLPLRIYSVVWHRKLALREAIHQSFPVAASLLPNLVFGLVLAELLKTTFQVPLDIVGAVIIYTVGATLAPPILMRVFWKSPEYAFLAEAESNLGATWGDEDANPR
ncbi:MAG TPA: cation:proton antiporter [Oligoflexia bacterium]|nr:cation:proton antiporter [Oligoflexia bacterium]